MYSPNTSKSIFALKIVCRYHRLKREVGYNTEVHTYANVNPYYQTFLTILTTPPSLSFTCWDSFREIQMSIRWVTQTFITPRCFMLIPDFSRGSHEAPRHIVYRLNFPCLFADVGSSENTFSLDSWVAVSCRPRNLQSLLKQTKRSLKQNPCQTVQKFPQLSLIPSH